MKLWLVNCFENPEMLGIEMRQPCNYHDGAENSNLTKTHRAFRLFLSGDTPCPEHTHTKIVSPKNDDTCEKWCP
jgi:hypothetical protein